MTQTQSETTFVRALAAGGPDATNAGALQIFGQFTGSWEHTWRFFDGRESSNGTGEWHFGWILQGRGVQDVFIAYNLRSAVRAVERGILRTATWTLYEEMRLKRRG